MRLTVLHLNVTTVDQIVLYSLSVKVISLQPRQEEKGKINKKGTQLRF
jgi:hypothetical protein